MMRQPNIRIGTGVPSVYGFGAFLLFALPLDVPKKSLPGALLLEMFVLLSLCLWW